MDHSDKWPNSSYSASSNTGTGKYRCSQELYRPPASRCNVQDYHPRHINNMQKSYSYYNEYRPNRTYTAWRSRYDYPRIYTNRNRIITNDSRRRINKRDQYWKNLSQFNKIEPYSDELKTTVTKKYDLIEYINRKIAFITNSLNDLSQIRDIEWDFLHQKNAGSDSSSKKSEKEKESHQTNPIKNIENNRSNSVAPLIFYRSTIKNYKSNIGGGIIRLKPESIEIINKKDNQAKSVIIPPYHHHPSPEYRNGLRDFEDLLFRIRNATIKHKFHSDTLITTLRSKIMSLCEYLLLNDLNRSTMSNIVQNTWESSYYEFIKFYRHENCLIIGQKYQNINEKKLSDEMLLLAKEGLEYFGSLLNRVLSHYNSPLKMLYDRHKYYKINPSLYSHLHDITYITKIIFIYLGDLWRYIDYITTDTQKQFSNSKKYYEKAHILVPKNSHICSQLSLVSFYQKNYFEAIYYNILSLDYEMVRDRSSNRFITKHFRVLSNRQNLVVFFDHIRSLYNMRLNNIRKEYELEMEKNKLKRKRIARGHSRINKYYRIEYWVRPNQTIAKCDMYNFYDLAAINSNEDDPDLLQFYQHNLLEKFSFQELKERFIISFLMVHGMLNYRTELDRFFDVVNQMFLEFDLLMAHIENFASKSHRQDSLSTFFMIRLFVINMYSIANTFYDNHQNAAFYGFTHSNAYFTMLIMISKIMKRLIKSFDTFRWMHNEFMSSLESKYKKPINDQEPENVEDCFGSFGNTFNESIDFEKDNQKINEWIEFYTLLPCLKLWCDWVIAFNPYFPPQEMNDIKTNIDQNVWQIFSEFLTLLHQIKQYPVNFYADENNKANLYLSSPKNDTETKDEYELVHLPEDRCLDGFKILRDIPESSKYVKLPFIPEIAFIYMRIESIKLFGDYLIGLKYPYLKFDPKTHCFESIVNVDDIENQPGLKLKQIQEQRLMHAMNRYKDYCKNLSLDNTNKNLKEEECYSDDEEAIQDINNLNLCPSEKRKLLQYRMFSKQNVIHGKYFKIIEHFKEPKRRFIIKPRYVIFDTNCFIEDLNTIINFVKTAPFTVTVPLIVIHELQHILSRGQRTYKQDDSLSGSLDQSKINRFRSLSTKALNILNFLKEIFTEKLNIKAITSKGFLLDRIDYKEEFYDPNAYNNDDLILFACDNLINKNHNLAPTDSFMRTLLESAGEYVSNHDEYLYRDVVLVTDDQNLRIKSLGYDVPVKKFKQFRKWTSTLTKI